MMAIAIQDINRSHELLMAADEFVLSVPGESMAKATMVCGWESLADSDKIKSLGLELVQSSSVAVPGLLRAAVFVLSSRDASVNFASRGRQA